MANKNFWYARHFKDYAAKTPHLSMMEHGAYALLLDHYYQSNGKLMANAMAIARVCRCQCDEERNAVQAVLDEFFALGEDGYYHNERADKELKISSDVSATRSAAGKQGAKRRWPALKIQSDDMAIGIANGMANGKQTGWQTDAQTQPQPHRNNMSSNSDCNAVLQYLNDKAGTNYRPVPANIKLIAARLKEGATVEDCKSVIDRKVSDWLNDQKFKSYLRPGTLFNAEKFAQYVGESDGQAKTQQWE